MALVGGKIQIRTIYHLHLKDADDPEGNIDNYLINTMFF